MKKEKISAGIRRFKFETMQIIAERFVNNIQASLRLEDIDDDTEWDYSYKDLKENELFTSNMLVFFRSLKYELLKIEDLSEVHFREIMEFYLPNFYEIPTVLLTRVKKLIERRFNMCSFDILKTAKFM